MTVNENSGFSAIYEALVKGNPVPKIWTLLVLNSEKEYLKVGQFIFSLYVFVQMQGIELVLHKMMTLIKSRVNTAHIFLFSYLMLSVTTVVPKPVY